MLSDLFLWPKIANQSIITFPDSQADISWDVFVSWANVN